MYSGLKGIHIQSKLHFTFQWFLSYTDCWCLEELRRGSNPNLQVSHTAMGMNSWHSSIYCVPKIFLYMWHFLYITRTSLLQCHCKLRSSYSSWIPHRKCYDHIDGARSHELWHTDSVVDFSLSKIMSCTAAFSLCIKDKLLTINIYIDSWAGRNSLTDLKGTSLEYLN